jgi:CRISPR-associated protein Csx17
MTLNVHHLTGCTPVPLAGYLKGLGILRLVSEQKDVGARGWWQDEHFCLMTSCDAAELTRFFLEDYAPTPFVSPWNKGSGFYSRDDAGLGPLESSVAPRFDAFRQGVRASRALLSELTVADRSIRELKERTRARAGMSASERTAAKALKEDPEFKTELASAERRFKNLKADLFTPCQRTWRGRHRDWFDAAVVVLDEGKVSWPSLLGTGGNDGRLDFTNNLMQRVGELFDVASPTGAPRPAASMLLQNSLWGHPASGLSAASVGQYQPGSAGGANSANGPEGDAMVNPWDFALMLEGTLFLRTSATRRLDVTSSMRASAPFSVRPQEVGYASRGGKASERGEQWMPLWSNPATAVDLSALFGEARLQLGPRLAYRPLDVARAVARLGVARGVGSFVRYGYLERNGQSNIAVPLGRVRVGARASSRLIDDLAPWLGHLDQIARDEQSSARLGMAHSLLADAVFSVLTHDDEPWRWQAVLLASVDIESIQVSGAGIKANPLPALSPGWLDATNDGTAEWRLACALGSASAEFRGGRPLDSVRHHWLPLDDRGRRFSIRDKRLAKDSRVVASGRDPVNDLLAVVTRRLVEASQRAERRLPIDAARGFSATPGDLSAWLSRGVDVPKVVGLARAFMSVRWDRAVVMKNHGSRMPDAAWPDEAWMAIRLACLPWPIDAHYNVPSDAAMVNRLAAGDGATAGDLALRRLRSAGLRPVVHAACADTETARLWAAALAFPVSQSVARAMARRLDSNVFKEIL